MLTVIKCNNPGVFHAVDNYEYEVGITLERTSSIISQL